MLFSVISLSLDRDDSFFDFSLILNQIDTLFETVDSSLPPLSKILISLISNSFSSSDFYEHCSVLNPDR